MGDLLDCTEDVWVTYNGKMVQPGDTMSHIGIGNHDTLRCGGRLRGGAQRYRSQPVDIPGHWTCQACGQERVLPVKTRCFRCGCPKGHVPPQLDLFCGWSLGSSLPKGRPHEPDLQAPASEFQALSPDRHDAKFSSIEPAIAGWSVDAAASGSVPVFPAGSLDWLVAFLQQIMSPEDHQKYKSSLRKRRLLWRCNWPTRPRKGARS